ncbi:MAG: hypothetical protein QN148_04070, partial [Armatimonadota bacterium]|nr:hypothetical protein [Armatimonadota bacterium]
MRSIVRVEGLVTSITGTGREGAPVSTSGVFRPYHEQVRSRTTSGDSRIAAGPIRAFPQPFASQYPRKSE